MLDVKFIRENPEVVRQGLLNKNAKDIVDEILQLDEQRRGFISKTEELKAKKNQVSAEIPKLKKAGQDTSAIFEEMKKVGDEITQLDSQLKEIEEKIENILRHTPNLAHASVPVGKSAEENVEVRRWLPEGFKFENDFKVLDHVELGKKLSLLDFERGTKISGSGFPLYTGKGATMERALINFMLDTHLQNHGYTEVMPPILVNRDSMKGTGQIPKMEEDMYFIEKDGLYPIPTAEVPITNIHRDEILAEKDLTIKYVGYSPCFRREAGSYGKDSKGFLRVHQFNKVEMVKFAKPDNSYDELEAMTNDAENILKALNVPYRILMLCTGDLSFSAAKCYDIETWSPAENKWLEASSCSNFEAFQARRANIRYRKEETKKPEFVHTLNGSGLATSRLMVSIMENNQTPEGKIIVPKALQKYTGFEVIG
ncbi:MAG: serine--tRNA ligase [Stygiobacter sp. RIFOXYC12_FULL_38_8]|nr:MAG: serine--tRNA ligase [Stygiobacter sp. RIFOXYA12_FULL_38_9]OGV09716.1 MAG: serine--tRNA ligase [Stygiobacter sp. RIFOXYB2_FULL_37_11]OGV10144.1 MAG: serine--tRNA ligase [Stygiobacter sp. RIFOXYA2_FULL_38_8]OGV13583.1 MAG: serine--tRNA ligase [Stygiobacter sp. RIFOXYC2_FULL_38_25]OGV26694.1 MAG: serine--tRNA ligase [Stygiobacter sp. RIFOXYC12_FULL_38_8]OGV79461.1 MAG: serine--tRNA ligase [Stygiobacter sp. GWF2_38_21]